MINADTRPANEKYDTSLREEARKYAYGTPVPKAAQLLVAMEEALFRAHKRNDELRKKLDRLETMQERSAHIKRAKEDRLDGLYQKILLTEGRHIVDGRSPEWAAITRFFLEDEGAMLPAARRQKREADNKML